MKLDHEQTAQLCENLALLLHSGISPADGMFLLAREETGETADLWEAMGHSLDSGIPLARVWEESGIFPVHTPAMIRVGEETGRLEEALQSLAAYHETRVRTTRQIRNALAYPCLILLLMLAVLAVLLIRVLPVFDAVYASLGSPMTGMAGLLLQLGQALKQALPLLAIPVLAAAAAAAVYRMYSPFRERMNSALRRRFGDRGVLRKFSNARFAQALGMGLRSGLTVDSAFELAQTLLADIPGAVSRCEDCANQLRSGSSLGQALESSGFLSPAHSRMLEASLRGGNADRVMEQLAQRMQEDAQNALEDRVAAVEPAMVLICSLLVGLILLAVMVPLLDILAMIG